MDKLHHGVTLERFCTVPDTVGTVAYWQRPLDEMYARLPFPDFWRGLRIQVWHMDHPDLDEQTKAGIANLQDYRPDVDGCQTAAGLHKEGLIRIGVFPKGWHPDKVSPHEITATDLAKARSCLSHEVGHYGDYKSGFWSVDPWTEKSVGVRKYNAIPDSLPIIQQEITRVYRSINSGQGHNIAETWAEDWRAANGDGTAYGTYSDNSAANLSPEQLSFLRCAYWLNAALQDDPVIPGSLKPMTTGCQWRQSVGWWGKEYHFITRNYTHYIYRNGDWVKK